MYPTRNISQLPAELIREIFKHLLSQHRHASTLLPRDRHRISTMAGIVHPSHEGRSHCFGMEKNSSCVCWQLDLLSVAIVCKSWYFIALEVMQSRQAQLQSINQQLPWLPLLDYPSFNRAYPMRSRLVDILKESRLAGLSFHKQVRHLVIDFASFDTIHQERVSKSSNAMIKRKVHNASALSDMVELIKLCAQAEKLDIVCDAGFTNLLTTTTVGSSHDTLRGRRYQSDYCSSNDDNNSILNASKVLQKAIIQQKTNIKRLDFVGFNPIQRCPCCAGKGWDKYLSPLIEGLHFVEKIVLQSVVPSKEVFQALSLNPNLRKIVFYKSMVTLPPQQKSRNRQVTKFTTSANIIPPSLWKQIRSVEIYEDIEDVTVWKSKRYLTELVDNAVGLETFVLQFGTREQNEQCLSLGCGSLINDSAKVTNVDSPLYALKTKFKDTLQHLSLVNVPEIY